MEHVLTVQVTATTQDCAIESKFLLGVHIKVLILYEVAEIMSASENVLFEIVTHFYEK